MDRTCGPVATTSAHASRLATCAVAGIRMPARDLRSPSPRGIWTSTLSVSIWTACFCDSATPSKLIVAPANRPHDDPGLGERTLGLRYRGFAEVEYRRREHGVRPPGDGAFDQVGEDAHPAA